jgi:hypothetical protein
MGLPHTWPLHKIWFFAVGHSAGRGSLYTSATAPNLVMRCGPLHRSWLCATGHSAEFEHALWDAAKKRAKKYTKKLLLWAAAGILVMLYGLEEHRSIDHSAE